MKIHETPARPPESGEPCEPCSRKAIASFPPVPSKPLFGVWCTVAEHEPETGKVYGGFSEPVLITMTNTDSGHAWVDIDKWDGPSKTWVDHGNEEGNPVQVTAWMPLPAPWRTPNAAHDGRPGETP